MKFYWLARGDFSEIEGPEHAPAGEGLIWCDLPREEARELREVAKTLEGLSLESEHALDAVSLEHPPFHDGTSHYDMLIVHELSSDDPWQLETTPLVIFASEAAVLTVRDGRSRAVRTLVGKLQRPGTRVPQTSGGLLHRLLQSALDAYLDLRRPITRQIDEWSQHLLSEDSDPRDWHRITLRRRQLSGLEELCQDHERALVSLQEDPALEIDDHLAVRLRDLVEHVTRVGSHARRATEDADNLVQLHFAATAHRTNETVRLLTALTGIFLPLTLIAGIFGMNFEHMPELRQPLGYPIALTGMGAIALGLIVLFRRWGWL